MQNKRIDIKWQRNLALLLLVISILLFTYLYLFLSKLLAYSWVFGVLVGIILEKSRICFTATLRDPILFGLTELARAIILSLMILTLGYAMIQHYQVSRALKLSGRFIPLGWHLPIGALIFGLGAAISGGCASGTLVRLGEGFQLQLVALIGFIIGSTQGAHDANFWYQFTSEYQLTHLPALIGWWPSLILQFLVLITLYIAAYLWERYKFK